MKDAKRPGELRASEHELDVTSLFPFPGDTFVDVGAHVGSWTLRLANLYRRVLAFEPNPSSYESLMRNLREAGLCNVSAYPIGLSRARGKKPLTVLDGVLSRSTFYPDFSSLPKTGRTDAEVIPLDEFEPLGEEDVSFIKVDTEGSELDVLTGAVKTLERWRPRLCIETHSASLYRDCSNLLRSLELDFTTLERGSHRFITRYAAGRDQV